LEGFGFEREKMNKIGEEPYWLEIYVSFDPHFKY
jgi:hypothetical protein